MGTLLGVTMRAWFRSAAPFGAATLTGGLVAAAAPGVVGGGWTAHLAWVALVPLLVVLPGSSPARAAMLGLVSGLVVDLWACSWMAGLLARFSGMHPALAVAAAVGIALWHGGAWALFALACRLGAKALPLALVAPAALVVVERFYPAIFPRSIGSTQYEQLWIAQTTELGGPFAISLLLALVAAAIAGLLRGRGRGHHAPQVALGAAAAAVAAAAVFGQVRAAEVRALRRAAPTIRVAALQGGVAREGWAPGEGDDRTLLERYQRLTATLEASHGPFDLIVWPEKAYPLPMRSDGRHDYRPGHRNRVRDGFDGTLLFGLTSVEPQTRQLGNSAAVLEPDGRLRIVYDKVELIPYSEWLPTWLAWLAGDGGRRYRPGSRFDPVPVAVGEGRLVPVSVFICFESTFPAHVRRLASGGPELMVNISDDSWFGDTAENEQHLAQSVLRAIESRRDLIRATGSGTSAAVAATGEVERRVGVSRPGGPPRTSLVHEPRLLRCDSIYGLLGDALCYVCLAATALALGLAGAGALRRRRRDRAAQ